MPRDFMRPGLGKTVKQQENFNLWMRCIEIWSADYEHNLGTMMTTQLTLDRLMSLAGEYEIETKSYGRVRITRKAKRGNTLVRNFRIQIAHLPTIVALTTIFPKPEMEQDPGGALIINVNRRRLDILEKIAREIHAGLDEYEVEKGVLMI